MKTNALIGMIVCIVGAILELTIQPVHISAGLWAITATLWAFGCYLLSEK